MANRINVESLQADLNKHLYTAGDERSEALARKVVRAALQEGVPVYDTAEDEGIISVMVLGVNALAAWSGPELRARLGDELRKLREDAEESPWQKVGSLDFQRVVMQVLAPHLIAAPRGEALHLYRIEDRELRQVAPLSDSRKDQTVEMSRLVAPHMNADGLGVTSRRLTEVHTNFMAKVQVVEPPDLLGQPDAEGYCLHRLRYRPDYDPHKTFPHIRQFIDRLWDADAFCAWLWGVVSGQNRGRQVLYVSDPRGEGGKSKFFSSIIEALFGQRISGTIASNSIAQKNPHSSSAFLNKRLLLIGDNNNAWLLLSAGFKELSGDDMLSINPKFVTPFSARLQCRCIVLSNFVPVVLQDRHNRSRTLWIGLEPLLIPPEDRDPGYGEKCVAELPQFLAHCERCYAARCVNHYEIQVNERVRTATDLRIAQCESMFAEQFDDHFVLDENGTLASKEWNKVVRELKLDLSKSEDFRQWIAAKFPQIVEQLDPRRPTKWAMEGIRLRRASDGLRADMAMAAVVRKPVPVPVAVLEPDPWAEMEVEGDA